MTPPHAVQQLEIGRRIVVIGPSNSGKSKLGRQIATQVDVPLIELDAVNWEPGWQPSRPEVFRARLQSLLLGPAARSGYVAAGNYSQVQDLTWERAETIVWLDLPLHVTLWRLLRRSWRRARARSLLWGTNRERFWPHLKLWSDESLVHYNLKQQRRRRQRYAAAMRDPQWRHLRFVRIPSTRGVEAFLRDIGAQP